ncbi:hypothetical protein SAMD00019534_108970 [Acytostelium subglobosum LB1]|uniref:hypothetical protein n=1 Tax=Acytostelium subglobosum LB1 TaxID=1410327 RepID=UPI000644F2AE|nr:hypothetical protein SAMD00019534_108970 [Acytostelium subglobosum LB1]GAM27721.1 hypothetical protein SAMD00019534_108970 [Acytostelium subglobosum LB1]|eukprot:XP_012749380.1 hypothetical protein SAMD00019534_108970 [Acytostelium subglobosum LB1]
MNSGISNNGATTTTTNTNISSRALGSPKMVTKLRRNTSVDGSLGGSSHHQQQSQHQPQPLQLQQQQQQGNAVQAPGKWVSVKPKAIMRSPRGGGASVHKGLLSKSRLVGASHQQRHQLLHHHHHNHTPTKRSDHLINRNNQLSFGSLSDLGALLPSVDDIQEGGGIKDTYRPNMISIGFTPGLRPLDSSSSSSSGGCAGDSSDILSSFPTSITTEKHVNGDWKLAHVPSQLARNNHPLVTGNNNASRNNSSRTLKSGEAYAVVLYDFEADCHDEMELIKDSIIVVCEQPSDGWWHGRHLDEDEPQVSSSSASTNAKPTRGIFPMNYVRILDEEEHRTLSATFGGGCGSFQVAHSPTPSPPQISFDPNLFFSTSTTHNKIRKLSSPKASVHIKVFVPPFNEHTVLRLSHNSTVKDALHKVLRKRKLLQALEGYKIHFKRWGSSDRSALPMDMPILMLSSSNDRLPKRVIGLRYSTVKRQQNEQHNKHIIVLKTLFQTIRLTCDANKSQADHWMQSIESSPDYLQDNPYLLKRQRKRLFTSTESLEDMFALDKRQLLKDIRNRYCNRYCSDCNGPDPEWASVSLGCFLCDVCCQIHQSVLGLQMSEIYSVLFDDAIHEMNNLNIMQSIGNAVSNEYWECRLKNRKIDANSLPAEKEAFIKSKYQKKEYVPLDLNIRPPIEWYQQSRPTTSTTSSSSQMSE